MTLMIHHIILPHMNHTASYPTDDDNDDYDDVATVQVRLHADTLLSAPSS